MEAIIGLGIVFFVSIIMIVIGIVQLRNKNPTGFYTGEKPPKPEEITNVKAWNHKHGMMWIIYGISLFISYFIGIWFNEMICSISMIAVSVGGVIIMCIYHSKLQTHYLKK